jgi:hypothetical protein
MQLIKVKIIEGKKGKYLPITITVNDEPDQFGNQGPVCIEQTKEEREAKAAKTYLGNVKVYGLMEHSLKKYLTKVEDCSTDHKINHKQ